MFYARWNAFFTNLPTQNWWHVQKHREEEQPAEHPLGDLTASNLEGCSNQIRSWFTRLQRIPALAGMLDDQTDDMVAHSFLVNPNLLK